MQTGQDLCEELYPVSEITSQDSWKSPPNNIENPYDDGQIDEILEILLDVVCSNRKQIRIAGDDKPAQVVKSQLMKLDSSHIEFVLDCMKQNTTQIRNVKQYILAALYNAPLTINNYYQSLVQHDMATGKI